MFLELTPNQEVFLTVFFMCFPFATGLFLTLYHLYRDPSADYFDEQYRKGLGIGLGVGVGMLLLEWFLFYAWPALMLLIVMLSIPMAIGLAPVVYRLWRDGRAATGQPVSPIHWEDLRALVKRWKNRKKDRKTDKSESSPEAEPPPVADEVVTTESPAPEA